MQVPWCFLKLSLVLPWVPSSLANLTVLGQKPLCWSVDITLLWDSPPVNTPKMPVWDVLVSICYTTDPLWLMHIVYHMTVSVIFPPNVNECITDNGNCDQNCTNTIGSFYCSCWVGCRLDGNGINCTGKFKAATICSRVLTFAVV